MRETNFTLGPIQKKLYLLLLYQFTFDQNRPKSDISGALGPIHYIGLQACTYLDRELQGALSFSVEGMGDGGLDGSVRKCVTDQLQGLQKAVLEKFLIARI